MTPDPKKPNPGLPVRSTRTQTGPPLSLTDEELEMLAEVTEEDIAEARKLWREAVPREFADLLDAEEGEA